MRFSAFLNASAKKTILLCYLVIVMVAIRNVTNLNWIQNTKLFSQSNSLFQAKPLKRTNAEKAPVHYETEEEFMRRMSRRMSDRVGRLRVACKKLGLPKTPFHSQVLMEGKRYNFVYCRVPKAGSTNMDRVFNHLIKESDYVVTRKRALLRNFSPHRVEYIAERNFSFSEIEKFLTFIIVRDPFVRLLSAYLMKVRNNGKNSKGKLSDPWLNSNEMPFNISFSDYVEHLLSHPGPYSTIERHWSLYIDLCQPCHVEYKIIAHLETIIEDMRYLLTLVGAPRNVSYNRGFGLDGSSKTKPEHLARYFNTVKKFKIQKLYNLYKPDFELFGYKPSRNLF